jgi:signal peptidase II
MPNRSAAWITAASFFLFDQLTKWWVAGPLGLTAEGDQLKLVPIFDLTRVHNWGISLGLFQAESDTGRWVLVAVTAAIAGLVTYWIVKEDKRGDQLALAMILGGALGNIVDRVRMGYVLDFLDLHFGTFRPFYVFNVADAAISIGVVILLIRALMPRSSASTEIEDNA